MKVLNKHLKIIPLAFIIAITFTLSPTQVFTTEAEAFISEPECVYAEYNSRVWGCHGATTRLCEGSSDCQNPNPEIE